MLKFNKHYFITTIVLFIIELLIALFVHDKFVRPYVGDVLVVILIYCFIKSFFKFPVLPVAIGTLLFAFMVETLQYFKIIEVLGLQESKLAKVIIGTSFAWEDMWAYVAGFIIILIFEKIYHRKNVNAQIHNQ